MLGMPLPPNNYTHVGAVNTTVANDNEQEPASSDPEGRDNVAMTFQEYGRIPYRDRWPESNSETTRKAAEFKENVILHCGLSIPTKIQEYGA